jgi:hypothetical protein
MIAMSLTLVACSAGGGPGSSATPAAGQTSAVASSAAATGAAPPSSAPTPVAPFVEPTDGASSAPTDAVPSTPDVPITGDVADLLPTEIAGNEMTIEPASDPERSFMILWNDEQIAQDLLDSLSAPDADIDVAYSYLTDSKYPDRVSVDAYRVVGADGVALRDGMAETYRQLLADQGDVQVTSQTVGGKDVAVLGVAGMAPDQAQYFYGVGDIVFVVSGSPFEWVEDALSQLP